MSWTDERVERLKQLWMDGRSASQIAAELANGITRNAVIGKVHRLGLSGRATTTTTQTARPQNARPSSPRPASQPSRGGGGGGGGPMTRGATALAYDPSEHVAVDIRPHAEVAIPISERVTIMELREAMCRWPLGDPTTPDFRFCGLKSPVGDSYCGYHSTLAYQPAHDRRRDRDRRMQRQA